MKLIQIGFLALIVSTLCFGKSIRSWSCQGYLTSGPEKYFRVNVLYDKSKNKYRATFSPTLTIMNTLSTFTLAPPTRSGKTMIRYQTKSPTLRKFFYLVINIGEEEEFRGVKASPAKVRMRFVIKPYLHEPKMYEYQENLYCKVGRWE